MEQFNPFDKRYRRYHPLTMLQFEVQLVEHCNLNCRGCDHFSPIAEKGFLDLDEYERDLARLSVLFDGACRRIYLLGGEPLLHPELVRAMKSTRQYFPYGQIIIVTNGLLLDQMPAEFWQACRDYAVGIKATKYPVNCDYDARQEKAQTEGVDFGYFNNAEQIKTLYRNSLSPTGHEQARKSFEHCYASNQCLNLRHGRMFTCSMAAFAPTLIQKYDLPMHASKRDGIDIYEAQSAEEILEFCAKPIPFCRYCSIDTRTSGEPYRQSCKDRYEWIEFEGRVADWEYLRQFGQVYICSDGDMGIMFAEQAGEHGISVRLLQSLESVMCVQAFGKETAFLLCYRDKKKRRAVENVLWDAKVEHMIPVYLPPHGAHA